MAELNVYQKPNLTWGWRLRDDAGRLLAVDGSAGYPAPRDAYDIANRIITGEFTTAERIQTS